MTYEEILDLRGPAIGYIYRRYPTLKDEAEDLVHDVLIKFMDLDLSQIENPRSMFFASVSNACIDRIRQWDRKHSSIFGRRVGWDKVEGNEKIWDKHFGDDGNFVPRELSVEDEIEPKLELQEMRSIIDGLRSKKRREALQLRLIGLTVPEIAEIMGCSVYAAKKRVWLGTQQVKEAMAYA